MGNKSYLGNISFFTSYLNGCLFIEVQIVETSHGYSVPYQNPEVDLSKTTIYDREMAYSRTVKPSQTKNSVAN